MNLLRWLANDEAPINQRQYSRSNQQHSRAVNNQLRIILNNQRIERLSTERVNVGAFFLTPPHDQRIEYVLPKRRQSIQEEKVVADDERIKANSECIYDFGIPRQRSHGKVDGSQNQVRNNHKDEEVLEVRNDFYLRQLRHARPAEPLQYEQRDHESCLTTGEHKEAAEKFSQQIDGPPHR